MRALGFGLIVVTGLACAAPCSTVAQQATSFDAGVLGAANPFQPNAALGQVGLRVATVRPQTVGVDFALATLPVAAAYGVLVLGADLDASWTVALSDGVRLMPRGGVGSAFGVALDGDGGAGAVVGVNAGIGLLRRTRAASAPPYLARAARQPVSWQPWGRDAFALAARLDRPILLYVGADDCRWCGVMDREVYGDPGLGAMIDSLFVPVRVDRDERPDVAQRYATAVQLLAGLRGYPITVFLTPDGSAFF